MSSILLSGGFAVDMSELWVLILVVAVLLYLFRGFIKNLFTIGAIVLIVAAVVFQMPGGPSVREPLSHFVQQVASGAKQIIGSAAAGKTTTVSTNNTPIIDSASLVVTHNKWRSQVGVPPLGWSDVLAKSAQGWADELKKKNCAMVHAKQKQYGENIFWGSAVRHSDGRREVQNISGKFVVNDWASEVRDYNSETNKCRSGSMCGHYTQIIWRDTKEVGCAMTICDDKSQVWVCRYNPPGNYKGERPY